MNNKSLALMYVYVSVSRYVDTKYVFCAKPNRELTLFATKRSMKLFLQYDSTEFSCFLFSLTIKIQLACPHTA